MDGRCKLTIGYKYHFPNVTIRLLCKVPIVSMLIRIAMQALGSCRGILSINLFVCDNNTNNPFINISFGGGGNLQSPSIVNVFAMVNALTSTLILFKSVIFHCGFVIDKFAINWEPNNGVAVLVWVGIFSFSLGAYCTQ
jgi:hypothetical protein